MIKILNIVIDYANEKEVIEYAKKLSIQSIDNCIELVVVINKVGSMDIEEFKRQLKLIPIKIFVFKAEDNLGYMNGLIYGYRRYIKENISLVNFVKPKWVIMSNTDIDFKDNFIISKFLNNKYDTSIWCIGPSVFNPIRGSYDNPQAKIRYSRYDLDKRIFIFKRPLISRMYQLLFELKRKFIKKKLSSSQFVYSVHGCFFILKDEFMEILQHKKFNSFLYGEEIFISELIRKNNKKCFFDSSIEVIHNEHSTTSSVKSKNRYVIESLEQLKKEFFYKD